MTLSAQQALELAISSARTQGATHADAIHIHGVDLSVSCRHRKQEQLERSEAAGVGLRVWVGESQAITSTSELSAHSIQTLAQQAITMARIATPDPYATLADPARLVTHAPELDLYDPSEPSPRVLFEQAQLCEATALAAQGITNSEGADASYSSHVLTLASSAGLLTHYRTSMHSLSVSVIAGSGSEMERDYDYSAARHRVDLRAAEAIGAQAAKRALARLSPTKKPTMQVPVVLDPRVGRNLLGAFLSGINGASVARGTSFLKDNMGQALFNPSIHISDDPLRVRGLASKPFDGEGVATRTNALVQDGILRTWLLDSRSAKQLGLQTTGNAARGMASPPSPSSTNAFIHAGEATVAELLSDIREGFYVTEMFGMGINTVTGDFSQGASGFWIENGEIVYPVSEMTIAGTMPEMFKNLHAANDLEFHYSSNTPTLRIEGMTVAGS